MKTSCRYFNPHFIAINPPELATPATFRGHLLPDALLQRGVLQHGAGREPLRNWRGTVEPKERNGGWLEEKNKKLYGFEMV